MKLNLDLKMIQPSADADMFDLLVNLKISKQDLVELIKKSVSGQVEVAFIDEVHYTGAELNDMFIESANEQGGE